MGKKDIKDMLSGVNPAQKKELLGKLLTALLCDLNETDKKEALRGVLTNRESSGHIIDMVER